MGNDSGSAERDRQREIDLEIICWKREEGRKAKMKMGIYKWRMEEEKRRSMDWQQRRGWKKRVMAISREMTQERGKKLNKRIWSLKPINSIGYKG